MRPMPNQADAKYTNPNSGKIRNATIRQIRLDPTEKQRGHVLRETHQSITLPDVGLKDGDVDVGVEG